MSVPRKSKPVGNPFSDLIEGEDPFLQILEVIDELILVKGPQSKILWANQAFRNFYGMSNEELKGIIDAPFNEPDLTAQYVKDDQLVFESKKRLNIPEELATRFDGKIAVFNTVKTPILNRGGEVVLTVGVSRDITEMKQARSMLEEQRTRAIHSAKMATLGEMAGGVAHEINTPLATIQLLSEQVSKMMDQPEIDRETVLRANERIQKTVARIAKIITGLRTFSRDGSKDEFTEVSVQRIVEDTLAFSRERILNHGVKLEYFFAPENPSVLGSHTQLSQVLLSLLSNSDDAVSEVTEKWIRIEVLVEGNEVELSVMDSGNGVSIEKQDKIFNPFFTTKEIGKGTGLGLSVSKSIIENHQGLLSLDVLSPFTRFKIRLPLHRKA